MLLLVYFNPGHLVIQAINYFNPGHLVIPAVNLALIGGIAIMGRPAKTTVGP